HTSHNGPPRSACSLLFLPFYFLRSWESSLAITPRVRLPFWIQSRLCVMNNCFKYAALGLLLALNSCMVGPKYVRPEVQMPRAFREELSAGWKEARPDDDAVRGEWWTVYNDPELNALEDQISISNQNVLAAEARFREEQAAVSIAKSQLFPTVSSGTSGTVS